MTQALASVFHIEVRQVTAPRPLQVFGYAHCMASLVRLRLPPDKTIAPRATSECCLVLAGS